MDGNQTALTTLPSEIENAALSSLMCWALTARLEDPIPHPLATIDAALMAARSRCRPADNRALAVAIDRLGRFAAAFAIPADALRDAVEIYRDTLVELPPDLLALAIRRAIAAHRYGMRLPLPGEILAHVAEEFAERKTVALRLDTLARKARRDAPPPPSGPPIDEAARKAAVAEAIAALTGGQSRDRPGKRETAELSGARPWINPAVLEELAEARARNEQPEAMEA